MTFDMKDMDTIRFESRGEIERLIFILNEWQEEHGPDETAQELIDKLEEIILSF